MKIATTKPNILTSLFLSFLFLKMLGWGMKLAREEESRSRRVGPGAVEGAEGGAPPITPLSLLASWSPI